MWVMAAIGGETSDLFARSWSTTRRCGQRHEEGSELKWLVGQSGDSIWWLRLRSGEYSLGARYELAYTFYLKNHEILQDPI